MRKILSILGFVLAISHNSALARPKLVELSWGDLSPLIVDHRITLHLPEDIRIKGRVLSVRNDSLLMNVKKTNNKKAYPKGQSLIPRAHVSLIDLRRKRGVKYRWILTPIGLALGAALAVGCIIDANESSGGNTGRCSAFPALAGGLGYLLGWGLDAKVMHIKIAGDPPETETTFNSPAQE